MASGEEAGEVEVTPEKLRIVALGLAAGGVDALLEFCAKLPGQPGYALVVIAHRDASDGKSLADMLSSHTALPAQMIRQGQPIKPNEIFVAPDDALVSALDGHFRLSKRLPDIHYPIDVFLASLSYDSELDAVAVILGGPGSDGAEGAAEIKSCGGYVLVQTPATAANDSMPSAAIDAALVDAIMAPALMPQAISDYFFAPPGDAPQKGPHDIGPEELAAALSTLRNNLGIDLSYYKEVNLRRRLLRRVLLRKDHSAHDYLQLLQQDETEAGALRDDLLIGVTSFFRNNELTEALVEQVIPGLLTPDAENIRIWVPACSTGEEAYTIAILFRAAMTRRNFPQQVQIFGTDVNMRAIAAARSGRYSAAAVENVPEEWRDWAFVREGNEYVVSKEVRALCVFAQHNVIANAPFSNIDFISCRNLFIYLHKEAQQQALEVFYSALKEEGYLLLGRSESASSTDLFRESGKGLNLYVKRLLPRRTPRHFPFEGKLNSDNGEREANQRRANSTRQLEEAANRTAIAHYVPAGFLVNETGEVLQFRGDTSPYLLPMTGDATLMLTRLLRPELQLDVRGALVEAVRTHKPVQRERLLFNDSLHMLEVLPVPYGGRVDQLFLITLRALARREEAPSSRSGKNQAEREDDLQRHLLALNEELDQTRSQLKAVIAEYEATNEELRTSNEEVLSSNEELQSANEELKIAKDELEATNRELASVNDELKLSNQQLALLNDDLSNLIEAIPLPVLLLDRNLKVRHFSPPARTLFQLSEEYIGQELAKAHMGFSPDALERLLRDVMDDLVPLAEEMQDKEQRWYLVQARAYRTKDHRIEGAVLSFQDIHGLKLALGDSENARREAERANAAKNDFLALISHELRSPLHTITGWTTVLKNVLGSGSQADEIVNKALGIIEHSGREQAQLIDDLLDVASISSGRLTLELSPVDFVSIVQTTLNGIAPPAQTKGLQIRASGLEQPIAVIGDARRLQQIVANLLQNSLKFTPTGGRIEVVVQRLNGLVELAVSDTGIGIDGALLPKIFERFAQDDISKTRRYGGLGLGLSIVKHLVAAHSGSVHAYSAGRGLGSRFVVRLPVTEQAASLPQQLSEAPMLTDTLRGLRLLIVDDESGGREALCHALNMAGAETTSAGSVEEALKLLTARTFDAVISDIAMPGMDGHQLAQALRRYEQEQHWPRLFLLALTGFTTLRERDAALAAGFDEHMGKPVDMPQLIRRLRLALRHRRGDIEN